ncbi:MAG TPA: propanediol/glycerol family dehydratase large subunit [Thermomicrobiales bacterium]
MSNSRDEANWGDAPPVRSGRFRALDERPVNLDGFVHEAPELGFAAMRSDGDPQASLRIEEGVVVELDGRGRASFDLIDLFIADHAIDRAVATEAMAIPALEFARRLVDPGVPAADLRRLAAGMTPARVVDVLNHLNIVELMMAAQKLRARRTPSNQAHVTNAKDDPALIAADAATATLAGFREVETTVAVARAAASNALALLVGSQTVVGGALAQCSVEEATELTLGLRGLTTYAETVSNYGTEDVFLDGDDTPWSKAFLAAAYTSCGLKLRFTSGSGVEVLMAHAEGRSMLYLEARCLAMTRGTGVQGVQNGGVDGVAIAGSVPGGARELMAENVLAMLWGLEVASGNDAMFSESEARRTARTMPQFFAGTDFVCSGFGSIPRYDNMFGPSNWNADDLDDWLVLQRDFDVDGGLTPYTEEAVLAARYRAACAVRDVFEELGLPPIAEEVVQGATFAHGSYEIPETSGVANARASDAILERGITGVDLVRALASRGYLDIAERVLAMLKQRLSGDYLQTAAILDRDFRVVSAVNDANDYRGPGTGYRVAGDRRAELAAIRQAVDPRQAPVVELRWPAVPFSLRPCAAAEPGVLPGEVVIGLGAAFGGELDRTLAGIDHGRVLKELLAGLEEEGAPVRLVRIRHTSDVAFVAQAAAKLSGSGIGVGIQSKGTTVIHHRALAPLSNLELFSVAPLMTPEHYRRIGRNAARYARGDHPEPILVDHLGQAIEPRYHTKAAALHLIETRLTAPGTPPVELTVSWELAPRHDHTEPPYVHR